MCWPTTVSSLQMPNYRDFSLGYTDRFEASLDSMVPKREHDGVQLVTGKLANRGKLLRNYNRLQYMLLVNLAFYHRALPLALYTGKYKMCLYGWTIKDQTIQSWSTYPDAVLTFPHSSANQWDEPAVPRQLYTNVNGLECCEFGDISESVI